MFTDASNCGWDLIDTQVRMYQDDKPVEEQAHEFLVCMVAFFVEHGSSDLSRKREDTASLKHVFNSSSCMLDSVYFADFTITQSWFTSSRRLSPLSITTVKAAALGSPSSALPI